MDWGQLSAQWGPAGLLALLLAGFVRAILRGDLVPRASVDKEIALHETRVADFKEAMATVDARNAELAKQVSILLPLAETSARSLEAIRAGVTSTQEPV